MKKTVLAILLISYSIFAQTSYRYIDSIFIPTQSYTNITYATAPELNVPYLGESSTHSSELKFNLFEPQGDTLSNRPLLICAHGGAFISGTKENDDMMEFSRVFAAKGYVTATIQYRLGMNLTSSVSGERSVYRALQDSRAAIRYFKENAATYKIDTNYVYFLGSSAGALMALHNLFMNEENERPAGSFKISHIPPTLDDGPDLGSLDAIEPQYIHGANADAIISLWGALQDTTLIKSTDNGRPVMLVHGTADNIVPFNVGSPFNLPVFPPTYGSNPINKRMSNLSFEEETYFVQGQGHEFYGVLNGNWNTAPNVYWDTVVTKSTYFLWNLHKPTAGFTYQNSNGYQVTFTNQSIGADTWLWNFGDGNSSTQQNPVHTYLSGQYTVTQTVFNKIRSWDTTSVSFSIIVNDVDDGKNFPTEFVLEQNYPNPFNPSTTIKYGISKESQVNLIIYNLLGKQIDILFNGIQSAGYYSKNWNASDFPSGVYFLQIQAVSIANNIIFTDAKKLVLMK